LQTLWAVLPRPFSAASQARPRSQVYHVTTPNGDRVCKMPIAGSKRCADALNTEAHTAARLAKAYPHGTSQMVRMGAYTDAATHNVSAIFSDYAPLGDLWCFMVLAPRSTPRDAACPPAVADAAGRSSREREVWVGAVSVQFLEQLADEMHSTLGAAHTDFKLNNVLVTGRKTAALQTGAGESLFTYPEVKVTDFGMTTSLGVPSPAGRGTTEFAPLEQEVGDNGVFTASAAVDVYAAAVTMLFMLTNARSPYRSVVGAQRYKQALSDKPYPDLSRLASDLRSGQAYMDLSKETLGVDLRAPVRHLLHWMLAPHPGDRPTMAAAIDEVKRTLLHGVDLA
jgi:serine/threonine protein kinase